MRATIDKAGRLVIPKQLRDEAGLRPGEVEVSVYGAGLRVEPLLGDDGLGVSGGRPVIPATGVRIDDTVVRALRDAGRK
jgi:AbrB family looped-hinge helix DNA binding protein